MNKNSWDSREINHIVSRQASWSFHVSSRPDPTNDVRISFETCGTATSTQISLIDQRRGGQTCLKLFLRLAVHFVICRRTLEPNWIVLQTKPSPKRGVHRSSQLQPEARKSTFIATSTKIIKTIPLLDNAFRAAPPNGNPWRKMLAHTYCGQSANARICTFHMIRQKMSH